MARYRKIDIRMHGDKKYRQLSDPQPCGKALWWQLLAGKQTGIIPGVCSIGECAFAEQLGWDLKGFREAFQEVLREGMVRVDWEAQLILVPRALKYNKPESPNVVRSWRDAWDELPECDLKIESWRTLKGFMESFGEAFLKAFEEACPKPSLKASPNQEQEQEQEQEQTKGDPTPPPQSTTPDPPKKTGSVLKTYPYPDWLNLELWHDFHRMRSRIKKPITTERTITGLLNALKKLVDAGHSQDETIQTAIDHCWQSFYPPKDGECGGPRNPQPGLTAQDVDDILSRDA